MLRNTYKARVPYNFNKAQKTFGKFIIVKTVSLFIITFSVVTAFHAQPKEKFRVN